MRTLEFISKNAGAIEIEAVNMLLKQKSPLFSDDAIEGDMTFPFDIPYDKAGKIKQWLKFPNRPEAVGEVISVEPIQVKRNGLPTLTGNLKLGDAKTKSISATLACGSAPFAALIKDKCLDEIDLGFQTFANEAELLAYWNATVNGNVLTHPYYLPTIISEPTGRINNYVKADSTYLLEQYGEKQYMSPMLYYSWLLPKVFEALGYELEDRVFINDTELREMLFFNIHNVNNQEDILTIYFADLLPHYKLSTWLIDIQNAIGVKFLFDNNKNKVTLDWQVSALNNVRKAKKVVHGDVIVKAISKRPTAFNYTLNDAQGVWESMVTELLPSVWHRKDMPNANDVPNKFCYVKNEDVLYRSIRNPESEYYWKISPVNYVNGVKLGGYFPVTYDGVPSSEDNYGPLITGFSIGNNEGESYSVASNIHPLHTHQVDFVSSGSGLLVNYTYKEEDEKTLPPYVLFATHSLDDDTDTVLSNFFSGNFSFIWHQNSWHLQNKILPWMQFRRDAKEIETTILQSELDLVNWDWTVPLDIDGSKVLVDIKEPLISSAANLMTVKITGFVL